MVRPRTGGYIQIGTYPNRDKPGKPDYEPGQGPFGAILGAACTDIAPPSPLNTKKMTPAAPCVAFIEGSAVSKNLELACI